VLKRCYENKDLFRLNVVVATDLHIADEVVLTSTTVSASPERQSPNALPPECQPMLNSFGATA